MSFTASPTAYASTGDGIQWQQPAFAPNTGLGSGNFATITSVTISANVVTFTVVQQATPFVTGQTVTISNMVHSTFLNAATLTVLAAGLSSTQFSANFTHADVAFLVDAGLATPNTTFAFAQNMDGAVTLTGGQSVLFATAETPWTGGGTFTANQLGNPCAYTVLGQIASGHGGDSVGEPTITSTSPNVTVPTLPVGATIVGIYPVALAPSHQISGALISLKAFFTGGGSPEGFSLTGSWENLGSIGTSLSVLSGAHFTLSCLASLSGIGDYWANVQAIGFAIVYTGGTQPPLNQLQTLQGTNSGFAIPGASLATGVQVTLNTGITTGTSSTLQVQLTLNGSPVGTPKPITVGSWASSYTLGSSSDVWGTGGLTSTQINGTTGLGVNVSGNLSTDTYINLNTLSITVYTTRIIPVVWVNVGNTRKPTV